MDYLNDRADEESTEQQATLDSLHFDYEQTQKELYRLNESYRKGNYEYDGGEEQYQQANQKPIAKCNKLKSKIDNFHDMAEDWREKTEQGYRNCQNAMSAFTKKGASYRTKRDILLSLCSKATLKGKRLVLELETPFEFIRNKLDEIQEKYQITEPGIIAELLDEKADKVIADAVKMTWRREWDSNPRYYC